MELNETKKRKKGEREWKFGEKEGIKGTVRAALTHHPDKFSKEACGKKGKKGGKMCPYAIFTAKKKEQNFEPHYKNQESTLKGKPKKKKKYTEEKVVKKFSEWLEERTRIN